jgi:hypothetical protein
MTAKKLQAADISTLVEWYVKSAITQVEAFSRPRDANKAFDIIYKIYRELRSRGESAQRALLPLLNHDHFGVRRWAGTHALEFAPDEGVPVLESIIESINKHQVRGDWGSLAASLIIAKMTLEQWKKGELKFP